jgi:hypothetical protein
MLSYQLDEDELKFGALWLFVGATGGAMGLLLIPWIGAFGSLYGLVQGTTQLWFFRTYLFKQRDQMGFHLFSAALGSFTFGLVTLLFQPLVLGAGALGGAVQGRLLLSFLRSTTQKKSRSKKKDQPDTTQWVPILACSGGITTLLILGLDRLPTLSPRLGDLVAAGQVLCWLVPGLSWAIIWAAPRVWQGLRPVRDYLERRLGIKFPKAVIGGSNRPAHRRLEFSLPWTLVGGLSGAIVGVLFVFANQIHSGLDQVVSETMIGAGILGGLYGFSQSLLQLLFLRLQGAKARQLLLTNLIGTGFGTVIFGFLASLLVYTLRLESLRSFVLVPIGVVLAGGAGGLLQGSIAWLFLRSRVAQGYPRWAFTLFCCGLVSAIAVVIVAPAIYLGILLIYCLEPGRCVMPQWQ